MTSIDPITKKPNITLTPEEEATEAYLRNVVAASYNEGVQVRPSTWDGKMTDTHLGDFEFKNRVPGEPLDLVNSTKWSSWGIKINHCQVCTSGPHVTTYEVNYEWGDTGKHEYIPEVCTACMNHINNTIIRNKVDRIFSD